MKQKLLEIIQVTFPNLFWRNLKYEEDGQKNMHFLHILCKIGENHGFWTIVALLFSFYQNNKILNSNLNYFQQLLFHIFPGDIENLRKNIQGVS